jgi:hypothetical protein
MCTLPGGIWCWLTAGYDRTMKIPSRLTALALCAIVAPHAHAHHSFAAMYDSSKPIRLTGKLVKVEWVNPHSHFDLEVKGKDGQVSLWSVEGAGPGSLSRRGFNRSDVKVGDTLTVDGYLAKSGKRVIDGQRVTLTDGRVFDSGSTGAGGPGAAVAPSPAGR